MTDYELLGVFYLGGFLDNQETHDFLLYDSRDLLAHSVCIADSRAGKTGLAICLIEEAAIDSIPVIAIDTKGDLSSLLLRFEDLSDETFFPWIDPDQARLNGLSAPELAKRESKKWRDELASSAQNAERIKRLNESAEFSFYTPASSLGIPLAIKSYFQCPAPEIVEDSDLLKEQIKNAVTNILLFAGITVEPKSKEHILLAAILQNYWKQNKDLSSVEMIGQIENPQIQRFGALDLEAFFPSAERHDFVLQLNNALASSDFELWTEGEPISIDKLLYNSKGKNKVSIISIAHLHAREQMFFISVLLTEVISWMRKQSGTSSLRALLSIDDFGSFLPSASNPSCKSHLKLLLNEAQRVGLGLALSSRKASDLDLGALAEVGTWFVGKVGNEIERQGILDLLAQSRRGSTVFDSKQLNLPLSQMQPQVFLLHNALHDSAPLLFKTRCTLSYFRPSLSRAQLKSIKASLATNSVSQHVDQGSFPPAPAEESNRADSHFADSPSHHSSVLRSQINGGLVADMGNSSDPFAKEKTTAAAPVPVPASAADAGKQINVAPRAKDTSDTSEGKETTGVALEANAGIPFAEHSNSKVSDANSNWYANTDATSSGFDHSTKSGISTTNSSINSSLNSSEQTRPANSELIQRYACVGRSGPEDSRLVYRPMLFASAQLRFLDVNSNIDCFKTLNYLFLIKSEDVPVRWEKALAANFAIDSMRKQADPKIELPALPACAAEITNYKKWKGEFESWLVNNQSLEIFRCPLTQISSTAQETEGEFRVRLQHASRVKRDGLIAALTEKYRLRQIELENKLAYAERLLRIELGESEALTEKQKKESKGFGNSVFQTFVGRKMPTKMLGADAQARENANLERVGDAQGQILRHQEYADNVRDQLDGLQIEFQSQLNDLKSRLDAETQPLDSIKLAPLPASYKLLAFCLCWAPCFRQADGKITAAW